MKNIIRSGNKEIVKQHKCGELEYLTFPIIEQTGFVKHMFSTRLGGVSEGMFQSMNLSFVRGDLKESVEENYRRIAAVLEQDSSDFVLSKQTHTTNVKRVTIQDRGKGISKPTDYDDVDGFITNEANIVLTTSFADCVPLFFVDPVKKAIGLSHSGWKGTVNKMAQKTVIRMQEEFGSNPKDLIAAIGPSICQSCYEVSEDVANQFKDIFIDPLKQERILLKKENEKYQLNLWQANKEIMMEAGILEKNIEVTDICTCCNKDYLFSHRASEGKRGNLGAFLCIC